MSYRDYWLRKRAYDEAVKTNAVIDVCSWCRKDIRARDQKIMDYVSGMVYSYHQDCYNEKRDKDWW
jgi:hypothetical protein